MAYGLTTDGSTVAKVSGRLPGQARLLSSGEWFAPHGGVWTVPEHEACGWYVIVDAGPGHDPAAEVVDTVSVDVVAGVPTRVYTVRAKTQAELDADAAAAADETERAAVRGLIPDLVDLAAPGSLTNAEQTQGIHKLARAVLRLVRDGQ